MKIPLSVPKTLENKYQKNMLTITQNQANERAFIFAVDQRIEHLCDDFYGPDIAPEAINPEHIFKIASQSPIGGLATHFGLIDRYAHEYPKIPYIIKLNGKSNLIDSKKRDPLSSSFYEIDQLVEQCASINLIGVGYTIYLGSEHESVMFRQAAQLVLSAHQNGLLALLWVYIRGNLFNPADHQLLSAGATGVALSLGADFVKIAQPSTIKELELAVKNSGNTKVICAGGAQEDPDLFLKNLESQLNAGTMGAATGRNIFQRPENEAIDLCNKIHQLLYR